jgi:hypothetical protein
VDRLRDYLQMSATALDVFSRSIVVSTITLVSGQARVVYFTPPYDITVSEITFISGTTASSGLTLARFGLYDPTELVARTASDTTLFNSTATAYTRSFDTAGGFPATFDLVAGTRYGVGFIFVGTTAGSVFGASQPGTGGQVLTALSPRICGVQNGLSDFQTGTLPVNNNGGVPFARLS